MSRPIGYLASHYPAVSHTFVMREVAALRDLGVEVETMSIWRTDPGDLLTEADREADRTTFAVLPTGPIPLVRAHTRAVARRPRRYLSTLVRALRLSTPGVRSRLWQLFYFAESMRIVEHCRACDVRHLHAQFADSATDVALLASHYLAPGLTWSLAVHGSVEFVDTRGNRLQAKVRDADWVQTISHFGRSQVMILLDESEWDKVHIVRCGIDPAVYAPRTDDAPAAAGELRILCVGRLLTGKGQALLVEAVSALGDRGVDARASLVGDGPNRGALEALALRLGVTDRLDLLGSVGQDVIRDHYEAADVFCLPSFAEGIPVVLMEAMALERPVVSTRITGIPELVEDGVSGLLVPPGDLGALVDALHELALDPKRRRRMGTAGRSKVLSEFDVRRSGAMLRDLFAESPPATAAGRD